MTNLVEIVKELSAYRNEQEWFEFTENWYEPHALGEYISALANSAALENKDTAYFIWGISDIEHKIVGTNFNYNQDVKNEPLKHFLARNLSPYIDFIFEEIFIDDKKIVVLTIPSAKTIPVSFKEERYIRIGSSKEKLKRYPEKEAHLFTILNNITPTIENIESDYQDLSFEQLLMYYGAKGIKLNLETYKKNLGLFTTEGKYNIMAQLLSDNSHIPIRVAIFSGTSKADNLFSIREFGNQCLLYSLDEVLRYGDVLNIIQADERQRIVDRKDIPLFNNEAFREAIINAFLHNKWIDQNEPMITVFSDRIEILSRGSLPKNQTIEGFFSGESIPVNRKLSEIFLQLHISEKTGRGVPTIIKQYGRNAFVFNEKSILVKIPFNWINRSSTYDNNCVEDSHVIYKPYINETNTRIFKEIKNNPYITKKELQVKLLKSKSTIDNGIAFLKDNGYITRVGANKNGYWKINNVTS